MIRALSLLSAGLLVSAISLAESLKFPVTTRTGTAEVKSRLLPVSRGPSEIELHLQIPQVDISVTDDGFQRIEANGLNTISQPGLPNVPTAGALIAIPAGYEVELEKIQERESIVEDIVIEPAQRRFRCGSGNADGFEFNRTVYDGNATFPTQNLRLEEVGEFHGLRLARVAFYPARFHPQSHRLVINSEILVRVHFKAVGTPTTVEMPRSMYNLVRSVTANGNGLQPNVRSRRGAESMWIVAADTLTDSLASLVSWKRAKGINVEVITVSAAGGTKEKIKSFLKAKFTAATAKPTYLLFVGNKDSAPAYKESTSSGAAATDWTYALLGSDEKIPAVFYGRLLADNVGEVTTQVNRWIAYEKNPALEGWYSQASTIASSEGSNPSDKEYAEQIQQALKAGTYTKTDGFYQGESTATESNINGALNDGRSWLSYFGHGSGTSWGSTNESYSNSTVAALKNANKLPVIIDVACQNGSWINLSKCFGKAWVTQESSGQAAGAVAFYGGSVNISWHEPAVMSVGIAKNHFEKKINTLGANVIAGQLYLFEKMGTGNNTLDNLKWYNLFGDPSMVMRTAAPGSYSLEHDVHPANGGGFEVAVHAGKGLTIALSSTEEGLMAVGTTDSNGSAVLKVKGALSSGTVLTASGYNMETKQVSVQ